MKPMTIRLDPAKSGGVLNHCINGGRQFDLRWDGDGFVLYLDGSPTAYKLRHYDDGGSWWIETTVVLP